MNDLGPLLASGRDADIFEFGTDQVVRRSRDGRSIAHEADIMTFARDRGFPVPEVVDVRANGTEIVMARVRGRTMVDEMRATPWKIPRLARVLASLHHQLHEIAAPAWLRAAPLGAGHQLIHLDLHPLNVMIDRRGPVVIDWANAARGDPATDAALAWILMAVGDVSAHGLEAFFIRAARTRLTTTFYRAYGGGEIDRVAAEVVAWKVLDPHMSDGEVTAMRALVSTR